MNKPNQVPAVGQAGTSDRLGEQLEPGSVCQLTIDGVEVTVAKGTTILDACGGRGCGIPTLCYGETITPKNACRVCMVEVE